MICLRECIDACKRGFIVRCRSLIGINGCHLKGTIGGQLLVAVGKDGNDNIFLIAYVIVEIEKKNLLDLVSTMSVG